MANRYNVLHPSDLTEVSLPAFAHGLLIATKAKGHFTVLHVEGDDEIHWSELPGIRQMLSDWGLISGPEDSEGVRALGLGVQKVIAAGDDPSSVCINYLERHPMDLVVLGTHQNEGWKRWSRTQVAEPIARAAHTQCLFIPSTAEGLVDIETGNVALNRILIPITRNPVPRAAISAAGELVKLLDVNEPEVTFLHVGDEDSAPIVKGTIPTDWQVFREIIEGDVVNRIIDYADDGGADLIVMTTKGHEGFLDMLRGSTTEQVLRRCNTAILAVTEN